MSESLTGFRKATDEECQTRKDLYSDAKGGVYVPIENEPVNSFRYNLNDARVAYNDGIEAAKSVIRNEVFRESDTADFIIPSLINAIARKTNPHSYTRAQSPAQSEWQPIESAPKYPEGVTPMLVYGAKRLEWAVAHRDVDNSWLVETCSDRINIYPPTHWMPLPQPPKEQQ